LPTADAEALALRVELLVGRLPEQGNHHHFVSPIKAMRDSSIERSCLAGSRPGHSWLVPAGHSPSKHAEVDHDRAWLALPVCHDDAVAVALRHQRAEDGGVPESFGHAAGVERVDGVG